MNDLILRFIVAVENIGTALTAMASGGTGQLNVPATPAAATDTAGAGTKPATTGKGKGKDKDKAPDAAADTSAADAAAAAEAADKAAKAKAEASKPKFDYELLKKAIIELASAGAEGKEAAMRILTDAGLARGEKADKADPGKWEGMHAAAVKALAVIKDSEAFA